ncbi:MAG: hypothetical protein PVI87_10305 [Gammaproteobacteria bacterium]|jgi:hypothetical protein
MNDPRYYQPGFAPPGYYPGAPAGMQPPAPMPPPIANTRFLKGAAIGALAAYLLSNPEVQQAAIRGAVKTWSLLQGGVEEMKERFRDAEAELHAASARDSD